MGSYLYTGNIQFHIAKEQEEPARQALFQFTREYLEGGISFRGKGILGHLQTFQMTLEDLSLDELCLFFGWSIQRSPLLETIDSLHFDEDCPSNEYQLFTLLAPYVTQGSFIELEVQEHGNAYQYRYVFTGTRILEQEAHYDPVPDERQEEQKERR